MTVSASDSETQRGILRAIRSSPVASEDQSHLL